MYEGKSKQETPGIPTYIMDLKHLILEKSTALKDSEPNLGHCQITTLQCCMREQAQP